MGLQQLIWRTSRGAQTALWFSQSLTDLLLLITSRDWSGCAGSSGKIRSKIWQSSNITCINSYSTLAHWLRSTAQGTNMKLVHKNQRLVSLPGTENMYRSCKCVLMCKLLTQPLFLYALLSRSPLSGLEQ